MTTGRIITGGKFPVVTPIDGPQKTDWLRTDQPECPSSDWFAGQALAQIGNEYVARGEVTRRAQEHAMTIAAHAYNIADAMIAARKGGAK